MNKNKPRVCLACQNCRRRKVKCTGGEVCNECRRFNAKCVYREHYREKKNFAIKILQSPDFVKKDNKHQSQQSAQASLPPPPRPPPPQQQQQQQPLIGFNHYQHPNQQQNHHQPPQTHLPPVVSHQDVLPHKPPTPAPEETLSVSPSPPAERPQREALGAASFLRKFNTFIESIGPMAQKPQYKISKDASEKLEQLRRLSPLTVGQSPTEFAIHDRQLTEEQMLQCLADFFNSYHIMIPMLDPETWIRKAKSAWRTMEYGNPWPNNPIELGIIYMVLALGCSGSFNMTFAGVEDQEWAKEYSRRAKLIVPSILECSSLRMVQYIMLRSIYEVSQGDAETGYIYSGIMIRNVMALDIHRADPTKDPSPECHERHRTWLCAYMWEKYWCYCVGRPSCIGQEFELPAPIASAFEKDSAYSMGIGHVAIRLKFVGTCSGMSQMSNGTHKDVPTAFRRAIEVANRLDDIISKSDEQFLITDNLESVGRLRDGQYKEWYWLRLYYWHNRLVLFRPFLVLSAYLDVPNCYDYGDISQEVLDALNKGSELCLEAALAIPPLVIAIDQRVERCQINWFTSSYLECSGVILLLYAICQPNAPEVSQCVKIFNDSCAYLNYGLANAGGSILSDSRLTLIQQLISDSSIRAALAKNRCNFVKIFFSLRMPGIEPFGRPVNADVAGGYQPDGHLNNAQLEDFWEKTLALVGFSG